jgi:hypothetical protein
MSIQDVLQRIILALDQAGIAYMLSGSFASAYYGASRSTQDIDIVIHASSEQLRSFIGALPVSEYYADLDSALEAHQRQSLVQCDRPSHRLEDRLHHSQVARLQPGSDRQVTHLGW